MTSGSMAPVLREGDVVAARPAATPPAPGTVVVFRDRDRQVVHRVVGVNGDGTYVTKGDANDDRDSDPVPIEAILGVARVKVPWIGRPARDLAAGRIEQVAATAVTLAVVAGMARWGVRSRFEPWWAPA